MTAYENIINTLYKFADRTDEIGFCPVSDNYIEVRWNAYCKPGIFAIVRQMIDVFDELDKNHDGLVYHIDGIEVYMKPYFEKK